MVNIGRAAGRSRAGMTLLEIVVVMGLLVTVTAIAIPNMLDVRAQMSATNAAHILARDLNRARVEAMRRNQQVALRRESDSTYSITGLAVQTLPDGAKFQHTFSDVTFASFGPVASGAGTIRIRVGDQKKDVRVEQAGFSYVEP